MRCATAAMSTRSRWRACIRIRRRSQRARRRRHLRCESRWRVRRRASRWRRSLALEPAAQERVSFPSLDGASNCTGRAHGCSGSRRRRIAGAGVALFHGCGGAYDRRGELTKRMRDYAALFNGAGYHVLVVDSLTPRYEIELCTQRNGTRRVTQSNRRLDALGAVAYLAERADVDPKRIGLVGWSNGGSTVLAATNLHHPDVAAAMVQAGVRVAFYPGCEADLKRGYEPDAPLLMLVGQADDWTPAAPCARWRGRRPSRGREIEVYAGAYHGFDTDRRCACARTCRTASTRARACTSAATRRRGARLASALAEVPVTDALSQPRPLGPRSGAGARTRRTSRWRRSSGAARRSRPARAARRTPRRVYLHEFSVWMRSPAAKRRCAAGPAHVDALRAPRGASRCAIGSSSKNATWRHCRGAKSLPIVRLRWRSALRLKAAVTPSASS